MTGRSAITIAPSAPREARVPRSGDRGQTAGLARCGWLVEIVLVSEREPDSRFFAVGTLDARDAEEATLRFPGIIREDERSARRRLSDAEIAFLKLREGGVKAYPLRAMRGPDY
jgi:hypothetical protein